MKQGPVRGFTLVELLVVVAVIGILVALLMPALNAVWADVETTQCAANLNQIWKAYGVRNGDQVAGDAELFTSDAWTVELKPYLENRSSWYTCPATPPGGMTHAGQAVSELLEFKTVGGSTWYVPFAEGEFVLKFSQTQYDDARSRGYLTEQADNLRSLYDCSYRPDGNKHVYWLCLEDHGYDWDFKDMMVKVAERPDGTVQLLGNAGSTGHHNYVVKKDGTVLMDVPSMAQGVTASIQGQGEDTSYGMNQNACGPADRLGRVLMMDYGQYLVRTDDDWLSEDFDINQDRLPDFARHPDGTVNALFTDGSVSLYEAQQFNPVYPSVAHKYWDF